MLDKVRTSLLAIGAAVCLGATPPALAQTSPVLEFSSGTPGTSDTLQSAGWEFTVINPITVVALDAFDNGAPTQVRLYNSSGTLVSADIVTSDPTEGSPFSFYTQPVAPTPLSPGTYYIAEDFSAGNIAYFDVTGITTNPAIAYVTGVDAFGLGQNPTGDVNGGSIDPAYFGPDFDIAVPGTPEPSAAVYGLSLVGLIGIRGWRNKRNRLRRCS